MDNIERTINEKLEQFTKLGIVSKKIKDRKKNKDLINRLYRGMAMIAIDLDIVKETIFEQHPNFAPLFDSLIELYGPEIKDPK